MISKILKNILLFFVLIFLQVFVFNHFYLSSFITPYIYLLFIIQLPFETPKWLLITLAFLTGLLLDIFSNSMGVHIIATVIVAYFRKNIYGLLFTTKDIDENVSPSIRDMGSTWFIYYTIFMVSIHHFFLFILEAFTFAHFSLIIVNIILSSIATSGLIIIIHILIERTTTKNTKIAKKI
ncbi:MAG: rod shape-determining protein MreD [Bacteroidetes bacterium GWE2_29_8]|nr:MAG: rod shape-determining protein MreD [Bacteroidetes bacterium GWE2_29_8]OFY22840.1 MAG: rod shape-determining protein MreD [Bacteroidetes bacterium GWF2_29_10]